MIGYQLLLQKFWNIVMFRLSILFYLLFSMSTNSTAQSQSTAIPIQKVVLYSSGVGYFEHNGQVNGSATTELRFRAAQMNDVLKSLLLQDLDGGRISTVVYPSQDPIDKILGSFDIDLSNNPSLGTVLAQMRGSSITIQAGNDIHSGVILGVETINKQIEGGLLTSEAVNIIHNGSIKSLLLSDMDGITIDDESLQDEFNKALQAVAQARDQDKKPLHISHEGNGQRRIRIGYVVETPVWKTSYRLVLPKTGETDGYLQGWAIIENQTENDWENVELTLISGRPISFIQDLYNPLYVQRPVVKFELQENLAPQMYERGMAVQADAETADNTRSGMRSQLLSAAPAPRSMAQPSMKEAMQSVQSSVITGETGELYQYIIGNVSLPRQRSAMIPIVTEEITIDRVSIFNREVHPRHPLHGAHLDNSTNVHLMQGPATVLDADSYAGDARLNEMPAGTRQLVSYALDFELVVDVKQRSADGEVQTARIVNGVLETQRKQVSEYTYTLKNDSDKERTLIVEHPRRQQWSLVDTTDPFESTQTLHRFKVDVPAETDKQTFSVNEELIRSQSVHLTNLDARSLGVIVKGGSIPDRVKAALTEAIAAKQRISQLEQQIQQKEKQTRDITTEQERIRENMSSVERNSSYYKRLLSKLESQEDEIESLQKEIQALQDTRTKQLNELQGYLNGLSIQ